MTLTWEANATVSLAFTGHQVQWIAPKGPSYGRAQISIDNAIVTTLSLYAADALPRLFERFYQGQDPGVSTGLGLGLYIARMLVESHGGRIWAESEPGQGSTFTLVLPRAAPEIDAATYA